MVTTPLSLGLYRLVEIHVFKTGVIEMEVLPLEGNGREFD
jgi:hypothetical protein